jgi:hypothetical protein
LWRAGVSVSWRCCQSTWKLSSCLTSDQWVWALHKKKAIIHHIRATIKVYSHRSRWQTYYTTRHYNSVSLLSV